MKNLLLTSLVVLLFTNIQCSKTPPPEPPTTQPDGLPLATQEGKNTFGCFWNDTLWLPKGGNFKPAIYCNFDIDSNWLIGFIYNDEKGETYSFAYRNLKIGENEFEDIYPNKVEIYKSKPTSSDYICKYPNTLKMNITKFVKPNKGTMPPTKGIVSGTFTAKFYKLNSSGSGVDTTNSITIKKAVFDLQLN